MAISFPSNPNVNDTFTVDDKTFLWTGDYWRTLSSAVTFPGIIKDADNDTKVEVEQSVDEDTIRFSVAGTEKASLDSSGLTVTGDISVTGSYVGLSSDSITDADGDTKIQVEESADEDTIRFDIAGAEKMTLDSSSLTVSDGVSADHFSASGTGANLIPSGTTAERPVSPTAGMIRFNETTGEPEYYHASAGWLKFRDAPIITVSYLVIAGGGSGGSRIGGGGGAGGYRNSFAQETSGRGGATEAPFDVTPGVSYTVSVGAGGSAVSSMPGTKGNNGTASTFDTVTSLGGGGGGAYGPGAGKNGGSGGGGSYSNALGGNGTSGQGYDGGDGSGSISGAGGGGAGSNGANGGSNNGGNGGSGVASVITGSSVVRGGGGGGAGSNSPGAGGSGGGGGGTNGNTTPAGSGTANTGGGGGGARNQSDTNNIFSGNGGSGVVILRYPSSSTIIIGAGLTGSTTVDGFDKITTITSGAGNVSWS